MIRKMRKRQSRQGFTLMELMVVIVIIGVLATAGFMTYQWAIGDSKYASAAASIGELKTMVFQYYNREGHYPAELEEAAGISNPPQKIPKDPWGNDYWYQEIDNGFQVGSDGASTETQDDDIYYDSIEQKIIDLTKDGPSDE